MRALVVARSEDVDALLGQCNKTRKEEGMEIYTTILSTVPPMYALSECVCMCMCKEKGVVQPMSLHKRTQQTRKK